MKRESWLPAAPESAPIARAIVRDLATEQGLDSEAVWDLMLATTEAVANAVVHGAACEGGIRLTIVASPDRLCVEICDCGAFGGSIAMAAPDAATGRGIPLIDAVTDHFELVPDGRYTRVRFGKARAQVAA
jgi:anti-sigma regulatory factor (Ser/Thr protein kinase)